EGEQAVTERQGEDRARKVAVFEWIDTGTVSSSGGGHGWRVKGGVSKGHLTSPRRWGWGPCWTADSVTFLCLALGSLPKPKQVLVRVALPFQARQPHVDGCLSPRVCSILKLPQDIGKHRERSSTFVLHI